MARIINYSETTAPSSGDYLIVDNAGGATKKLAVANLMEDTPTSGSRKALSSNGAYDLKEDLEQLVQTPQETDADFYVSDESGNVILEVADGHVKTANFDSSDINLTTDATPTEGSTNAVQSGGVYDAIAEVSEAIPDVTGFAEIKIPEESAADFYIADSNGNVIAQFAGGHIETANFDSSTVLTESDIETLESLVSGLASTVAKASSTLPSTESDVDLDITDSSGNVIMRLADGHIKTANFDSSLTDQNAVKTVNSTAPDANGNVDVVAELDAEELQSAVDTYLTENPVVAAACGIVSVDDYGAVGDGTTDDSAAIQSAVAANYDVYFESGKTYYLASTVTIDHDIYLHGGDDTTIKTATPEEDEPYNGIVVTGTLKTTTTLTSDYYSEGTDDVDNICNRITLADMSSVEVGDILVIRATDQFYSYARRYYYLGATLIVTDIYEDHLYVNRDMPWDISLTEDVTVEVYNAPTLKVSNLNFVGDLDAFGGTYYGSYASLLRMEYCKDSEIRNCDFNHFKVGLKADYCVNTLIDNVTLSKSRWINTSQLGDGYGLDIYSCTHTSIRRVIALCSQGCIDLGGDIPNIDTFVSQCDLASECRATGLDLHDNSYSIVVEDCVLGGMAISGNATINRCQFVRNVRGGGYGTITLRGLTNPEWSRVVISNCTFPVNAYCYVSFKAQTAQDGYVQAYDNIIDKVIIENCTGGGIKYEVSTDDVVLSNVINNLILRNCRDLHEILCSGDGIIKNLEITDCQFTERYYINTGSEEFDTTGIENLLIRKTVPISEIMHVNKADTWGDMYYLPEGVEIAVSSDDTSAVYFVCGENLASNDIEDYDVGTVTGSAGSSIVRTVDTDASSMLTADSNGNFVYTIPSDYTSKQAIIPKCFICDNTDGAKVLNVSATLKNTGSTDGSTFYVYIVIIDKETGLITYRNTGSAVQATSDGATITHTRNVPEDHVAFWYLIPSTVVSGSETTIENLMVSLTAYDNAVPSYTAYEGNKVTGNGTLTSINGKNCIQSSAQNFDVQFIADYTK